MPTDSDDMADAPSRLSSKRLWLILGLILLGIVVLVPIIAWKSVFETPPTEAELEAGLAENAKHVVPPDELDPPSAANPESPSDEFDESGEEPVSMRALSLDELEAIASKGELVLYTFRDESVTWKDMTGVPFAESLQAVRRVDQSIPAAQHKHELAQLGNGWDVIPSVMGQMTRTATIGERLINAQIYGHLQRGYAHCAGRTFVSDHAIDLTKRIDFAAADEAIEQGLQSSREHLRFWNSMADDFTVQHAEEFYDSSPILQAMHGREVMKNIVSAHSKNHIFGTDRVLAALLPFGSDDSGSPPKWLRYEWESCFYRIAAVDQAAIDPSLFVPLVEEREAPRDVIHFGYYAPHERAKVEALVHSFLRPDRSVDVARADSFHRSRSAISVATFLLTDTNAPIKGISTMQWPLSTAQSTYKGIGPGKLFFERQAGSSGEYYGFVYLGEPLLGPSGKGRDPLSDYTVRNSAIDAISRASWRTLKGDFHPHPRLSITPYALTRKWGGWFHPPIDWRAIQSPSVKETPAERVIIDDVFKQLSLGLSAKCPNWKTLEDHWHAGRWWAFRMLLEEEKESRGVKLSNDQELLLMRWYSLPSVEFAPH